MQENAILKCKCARCGKTGIYALSEQESRLRSEYAEKGRSMGSLRDIFPDVPEWILYGSLDPMQGGRCVCPSCERKAR